jgi:hypothetical protein
MSRRVLGIVVYFSATAFANGCGNETRAALPQHDPRAAAGVIHLEPDAHFEAVIGDKAEIGQIGAATRLADGRVAATDRSFGRVVFFAPDGQVISTSGRSGTGPGEFINPSWIGRCSTDTLYIWDPQQSRITVMSSAGRVIRQFPLRFRPNRLACNDAGMLAGTVLTDPRAQVKMSEDSPTLEGAVVLSNAQGDSVAAITGLPVYRNRPLGGLASIGLTATRLYFGFPGSASVSRYTLAGGLDTAFPVGDASRPPTRAHYEAAVEDILSIFTTPADRNPFRAEFLAIPMPATLPAFRQILVAPNATVWVVTSPLGDERTVLEALDSAGNRIGTVDLPANFTVSDVGADYILGISHTPEGAQRIQSFRILQQR